MRPRLQHHLAVLRRSRFGGLVARWGPALVGVLVLATVVAQVGAAPVRAALHDLRWPAVAAALAIGLVSTLCCAWRWSLVARQVGVALPWPRAVAAYYASQFLNSTTPGGVAGDVRRTVHHGREVARPGRAVKAVVAERAAGQGVQLAVTIAVLTLPASPIRVPLWLAPCAALGVAIVLWRTLRARWAAVALASATVVAGHTATFVLAARLAGSTASLATLLPAASLVLAAMALPMNVAGWGPREGAAAWTFASLGLGASQGLTTATLYGLLALMASLPGAVVMVAGRWTRRA